MNCQTCQSELEDLLYGELNAARQATLNEHLSVCADCRAAQTVLERENELFAQFYEQNALEPSDEMWAAIRTRIQPETTATETSSAGWSERFRHWLGPIFAPTMLRQAGFAALLILLSVGSTALYFTARKTENNQLATVTPSPSPRSMATPATPVPRQTTPAATPQPTAPQALPPTPRLNTNESPKPQLAALKPSAPKVEAKSAPTKLSEDELLTQQIAKASREYKSAIHLLERTIAKRKTQLDEGTVKQFEGSLAMIDASIASSRQALRAHPNDPTAARFLLAAYSKKVELMQEIAMR